MLGVGLELHYLGNIFLQVYKRFVEIGRVVLINEGPDLGKLCVIIDLVDQRRVSHMYHYSQHT